MHDAAESGRKFRVLSVRRAPAGAFGAGGGDEFCEPASDAGVGEGLDEKSAIRRSAAFARLIQRFVRPL